MKRPMGGICRALAAVAMACAMLPSTYAQSYPAKPIRVVIGFAPGGAADIVGRVLAPVLTENLGQSVVIDNRGGAGGIIGMDAVAKAPADGYTLGLGSSGNLIVAPHLYQKVPYNVLKDLAPISMLAVAAYVVAINPTVPAKNMSEFVALAKSKPNLLSFGSSGNGSSSHIAGELLALAIGAKMVHVPYKGTGPSLTAVVGGEIDMMVSDLTPALPFAKSGRLRLLATIATKRASIAPDIPTVAESGVKMHPMEGRYAIVAPAGTPADVITRLHTAIIAALKNNEVKQRFGQLGFDIVGDTPDHLASVLKTEGEIIGAVIKKAGIKPEG